MVLYRSLCCGPPFAAEAYTHAMKFKFRRYYLYYWARLAALLFQVLPVRVGVWIGGVFGLAAYCFLGAYRHLTIANLTAALGGEKSEADIRRIARSVFLNLGKNAAEFVNFPKIGLHNIDRYVDIRDRERIDRALEKRRGIIAITGHFGNWELLAVTLRLKGYSGLVVGKKIYFDRYDRFLNRMRKLQSVDIVYRDESPRRILKALKANGIVGIVADQDVDSVDGVFVDFFGKAAYTPAGPAMLAKMSGAALMPMFILRRGSRHILAVEEPIELVDTGDKGRDLIENTRRWSVAVEAYIRRYPEQWVWMHRRWKTRPNGEVAI